MSAIPKSASLLAPSLQLLVLLSRLKLSDTQEKAALTLCQRIDDWSQVSHQAQQRFVLPLVYRHLRRLAPETLSPLQLDTMKHQCMAAVQHNMLVITAQRKLVRDLLLPLDIRHLFFKGPALAARYYDEPAMRFSRDIDVLVPRNRMVELLEVALDRGYIPHDPKQPQTDRTSLVFLARVQGVITLLTPQGVAIEFHQRIDNTGTIYDTSELLSSAEPMRLGDAEISVMPTAELFVYICLHHTKHFWSHLHWLVDLDAIQRHPTFDLDTVRAYAARRNLTATVEACLDFYRAMSAPEPWRYQPNSEHGGELLVASLAALKGGLAKELEMHKKKATPDFSFAWQARTTHWLRWQVLGWLRLFRPSYADYKSWPLPPRWQWLYRVTRPFRELIARVTPGSTAK
ncbi:hypothetical protein L861_02670 [Litchfieldella anticariensis FP35 = DSM 16096]|uniref:Nucleotidyltransferase family protein n=1 Tax=Litchfieldella anticariensis (strain DSM 16096 / CECT 5854 / CIP 108499 / LMG 22089 / FP35) TaxID=1121939 RepID=S2KQ85_LITA3|nr:nucleotidyltransferase family protein [Halomonas anticariensis]EPC04237.1 hypothetical protein L861_02670 [Halomonas anticariensis FP35 = DSM 16096]